MTRVKPVDYLQTTGKAKSLLDAVQAKLGKTPNMLTTMAQSPAVLEAYLNFSGALSSGKINAKLREELALVTAEINQCDYCAAAHTAFGKMAGLTEPEITAARKGHSGDAKGEAALSFARAVIINRGEVTSAEFVAVRSAGFDDGEIAEIVAAVALNIFTNYFNKIMQTEVDFPAVRSVASA